MIAVPELTQTLNLNPTGRLLHLAQRHGAASLDPSIRFWAKQNSKTLSMLLVQARNPISGTKKFQHQGSRGSNELRYATQVVAWPSAGRAVMGVTRTTGSPSCPVVSGVPEKVRICIQS